MTDNEKLDYMIAERLIISSKHPNNEYNNDLVRWLNELKTLRVELEKNSQELEVYKKAFDYACYRLETLDMGSSHSWKARTWKKVILEKVNNSNKNN